MTTDDSQSVQTTNTVCPIKSQLIQIKRFAHPDQLGLIRAPVIVFSSFAEEVSALRLSSDRLHDRALDKLAGAEIFPQSHEQFTRQRCDRHFLACLGGADTDFREIPACQG